jgi:hypothetical protein
MKRLIWQNYDVSVDDYEDFLNEEYPRITDEYEKQDLCDGINNDYLEDERVNLNKELNTGIVIYGDVGRWDGIRKGHRFVCGNDGNTKVFANLSDVLCFEKDCELAEWYVEYGEIKTTQCHHDGTHELTYRALVYDKDRISIYEIEDAFHKNAADAIAKYTRSLAPDVCEVYGWEVDS